MAATVSRGNQWPDGSPCPLGSTLLVSGEDFISEDDESDDTTLPRLIAANADMNNVHYISQNEFHLFKLLPNLEAEIRQKRDLNLIVIDPITAFLGKLDGNSNSDIRGLLAPLSQMASRTNTAILAVSHLNKNDHGKAIYRTTGSLAFNAAARAVWLMAQHPKDSSRRVLHPIKNNIAPDIGGLCFSLSDDQPPRVLWDDEPVFYEENEIFSTSNESKMTGLHEAMQFLNERLVGGPIDVSHLRANAKELGLSWRTVERAKQELGIKTKRIGFGPDGIHQWSMPE